MRLGLRQRRPPGGYAVGESPLSGSMYAVALEIRLSLCDDVPITRAGAS